MDGAGNWDRIETPSTPIANEPSTGEGPMSSHPFPASSALWRRFLRCLMQGAADEAAHLSPLPCKAPHRVQGDGREQQASPFSGMQVLGRRISEEHWDVTGQLVTEDGEMRGNAARNILN